MNPRAPAAGEVHVWCLDASAPLDPPRQQRLRQALSSAEIEREARLRFAGDRQTHLLTRALVRHVLSACTGVAAAELRFVANAFGKPALAAAAGVPVPSFNVSHTDGLIVLALQRDGAIGVDVEKVCARHASLDIAARFFAPAEVAALRGVGDDALAPAFFRYWTLKEAYVKARGVGLSVPLDEFAFLLGPAPGRIALQPAPGDTAAAWKFWQFATGKEHVLAVCAARAPGGRPRLRLRRIEAHRLDEGRLDAAIAAELIGESAHD